MEKHNIQPERITKPIQLLGAWLVGLLTIDATFLFAATNMPPNSWEAGALTIAAILNVPTFIGALFVLQTKFRPELQEDSYYSSYLNNRTNQVITISKKDVLLEELAGKIKHIEARGRELDTVSEHSFLADLAFGVNVHLPNQTAIEEALFEAGVRVIREFGEKTGAPDEAKVAVAAHLPVHVKNEVLGFARKLGIEHYGIIEPWEDIEEDVLFGAYGESEGKITHKAT